VWRGGETIVLFRGEHGLLSLYLRPEAAYRERSADESRGCRVIWQLFERERAKLEGISGRQFEFHYLDVEHSNHEVEEVVAAAEVVIDFIAYANPSLYVTSPLEVFEISFMTNLQVARLCAKHGTRLVQCSTSEVYGSATSGVFDEEASPLVMGPVSKQRWIYATSKQLLERVIHALGIRDGLQYTIARPFNVIGPRLDYLVPAGSTGGPRVFAHFMSALLTGGAMFLVNGGRVSRCFTHVADAVTAFQYFIEHPGAVNRIFNFGNPENNLSIREFAMLMRELYEELTGEPARSELIEISGEEFYGIGYEDMDRVPPSIERLRALGWEPRHNIRETLHDAMTYYLFGEGREATIEPIAFGS
jgi:UDP-apiose/xylose synthase